MKKKLLLLETEMKSPRGHYLDNLIESFYFFENDFSIYCLLNEVFDPQGTFIPKELKINKILNRNNFEKKEKKFLHYLFEIIFFFKRLISSLILIPYFIINKNILNYLKALLSNNLILPRYFIELFFFLKKNEFTSYDHILFQTTRNKHMSLANFLTRLEKNIPKIHLRILYTPSSKKLRGFFYFLNKIKLFLINKKIFLYVLTKQNFEILSNHLNIKNGIFLSNIPWVFFERKNKKSFKTVGYMGDARVSRGFNKLPSLIDKLSKTSKDFKFIIQYSKVDIAVKETSDKLFEMAKSNPNIKIYLKYMDYKEFRDTLQNIDIMPILHDAEEINLGNPSTIYSSITHQIPMTIPSNLKYMKDVLVHKSFEEADAIDNIVDKIVKIKNNYEEYLSSAKKNSSILLNIFNDDPLKKNIN
ncbi:MAG: hypothetical protein ISQ26_10050 [Candidatus Puniceispirillum sp.]|nr:hypothetical protein [Candidatus Puniceispirillum sp.]